MLRCLCFRAIANSRRQVRFNSTSMQSGTAELVPSALSNKHLSVDAAAGVPEVDLEFIEEPLGISVEQGYGFPRFEFGETLGPDGHRFKLVRKLGFGRNSSTWLSRDERFVRIAGVPGSLNGCRLTREQKYVAIKALTGYATFIMQQGVSWELSALKRISSPGSVSAHCLSLLSHFTHRGRGNDGEHLCLVTDVMGGDVRSLQLSLTGEPKVFPLPLAKRILLHTLRGIAHIHSCGVVHTDLKHDNIMFSAKSASPAYIDALLAADPPRHNPPEESWDSIVQSAVSQPLPQPSLEEAMTRTYVVSDFGSGELFLSPPQFSAWHSQSGCAKTSPVLDGPHCRQHHGRRTSGSRDDSAWSLGRKSGHMDIRMPRTLGFIFTPTPVDSVVLTRDRNLTRSLKWS